MRLTFWKKKKPKKKRAAAKRKARREYRTAIQKLHQLERNDRWDNEILARLDAIMAFLRKHDVDVKDRIDQLALARRVLRETNLEEIIAEKISQGMRSRDIVKDLVSQGACSRATAYRYLSRQSRLLKVSVRSR